MRDDTILSLDDNAAPTLAALRAASRLSQAEVAQRLGIASSMIEAWEGGRTYPCPRQQQALCALFQITRPALFLALAATPVAALAPLAADLPPRHDHDMGAPGGAERSRRR